MHQSILQNILNTGPQEKAHYKKTIMLARSQSKCTCRPVSTIPPIEGVIEIEPGIYAHFFDRLASQIHSDYVDFVDIDTLMDTTEFSSVAFRQACCTIPRLSKLVFFHPSFTTKARARTRFNIYDEASMVAAVSSSQAEGIAVRDIGESYTDAGNDLSKLLKTRRVVFIHNRIYSSAIARSEVPGALKAWLPPRQCQQQNS